MTDIRSGFLALVLIVCGMFACAQPPALEPDTTASFKAFLVEWETAQARFINGDPSLWKQHTSHADDVTIVGGFGGEGEKGWPAVGARYDWASSQYKDSGATMKVDYLNVAVSGDQAFTVGVERQEGARVGDQGPARRALRVTQIFRREQGAWKLVHRHADQVVVKEDPSSPVSK